MCSSDLEGGGLPVPHDDETPAESPPSLTAGDTLSLPGLRLRMFGPDSLRDEFGLPSDEAPAPFGTGAPEPRYHVLYVESDADGRFALSTASDVAYLTWVPSVKRVTWDVQVVTERGAPVTDHLDIEADVPMVVLYKDPFVLRVPDALGGGWLMFLVRVRYRESMLVPNETTSDPIELARQAESSADNPPGPGGAIMDIVAWHCTSQTFRDGTIKGPFLVVDSLLALQGYSGDGVDPIPLFRTRLGAPTALWVEDGDGETQLLVYYNVNRSYSIDRNGHWIEAGTFDAPFETKHEEMRTEYNEAVWLDGEQRFRSGVGVCAIPSKVVKYAISGHDALPGAPDPYLHQHSWSASGSIFQPVRYYYDDGTGNLVTFAEAIIERVRSNQDSGDPTVAIEKEDAVHPRSSDPGGFADSFGAEAHFTTITETDAVEDEEGEDDTASEARNSEVSAVPYSNTLHGLWRFRLLSEGAILSSGTAMFGRDLAATASRQMTVTWRASKQSNDRVDADPVRIDGHEYITFVRDNDSQAFFRLDRP